MERIHLGSFCNFSLPQPWMCLGRNNCFCCPGLLSTPLHSSCASLSEGKQAPSRWCPPSEHLSKPKRVCFICIQFFFPGKIMDNYCLNYSGLFLELFIWRWERVVSVTYLAYHLYVWSCPLATNGKVFFSFISRCLLIWSCRRMKAPSFQEQIIKT